MNTEPNTSTQFTVLFTAQKYKKHKTWQDGTIVYYNFNRKIILIDEKGYNIDKKFSKTGTPAVGDEIEFDLHLVTVESLDSQTMQQQQSIPNPQAAPIAPSPQPTNNDRQIGSDNLQNDISRLKIDQQPAKRRLRRANIGLRPNRGNSFIVPTAINNNNNLIGSINHNQINNQNEQTAISNQHNHLNQQQVNPTRVTSSNTFINEPNEQNLISPNVIEIDTTTHTSNSFNNSSESSNRSLINLINFTPNDEQITPDKSQINNNKNNYVISNTSVNNIINETNDIQMTNVQQVQQQIGTKRTTKETDINVQKRVRIGLSKNSAKPLHPNFTINSNESTPSGDRTLPSIVNPSNENNIPPTSSTTKPLILTASSSFLPASRISSENNESASNSSSPSNTPAVSKRFKVPYADGVSVPLVLFFPTLEKAMAVIKTRQLPKRTKAIPTKFKNITEYKEIFKKAIHEHLQLMLLNNAMHYFLHSNNATNNNLERFFRSKGLGFYTGCKLKNNSYYAFDDVFNLAVKNRENHNRYSKDDIWVISTSLAFDPSQTFLGRSTFYGPSSNGCIEFKCITPRDLRIASKMPTEQPCLFALRTISAGSEFMMLDTLEDTLDKLPILPNILNDGKRSRKKNQPEPLHASVNINKLAAIKLTEEDSIGVSEKLDETIQEYKLNEDQASALRLMAKSVIVAPGWNEDANNAITLVHGVFGSGKSFLAAVMVIFLRNIIDTVNNRREPDDQINFKIMIACFTNVAVDRILSVLVKLGYDNFVRIGSLKRIAKNLLPYTVKAKISGNDELKELEQMLDDPNNTDEEIENISNAIQRFRRSENILEVHRADVVGTTCNASSFEIFSESVYPFILMDECSQIMEPMTIVPLARFKCSRMVMIGDPLQLPPTISTQSDEDKIGQGLDKTLFSRLIEMKTQSIMLRAQYRCHPKISAISNKLFYDNRLINGQTVETRPPLVNGLSPLVFVDVLGNDQKSIGNSFWNRDEVAIVAHTVRELNNLGIDGSKIGIISLYKEQVDRIQTSLGNDSNNQSNINNIQISTVDAFQGAEKEVIILSTVRTSGSGFIDQLTRVNVALTRARRHLIILGSKNLLSNNETWSKILMECQGNIFTIQEFTGYLTSLQTLDSSITS